MSNHQYPLDKVGNKHIAFLLERLWRKTGELSEGSYMCCSSFHFAFCFVVVVVFVFTLLRPSGIPFKRIGY